jgi:hypothetical protein
MFMCIGPCCWGKGSTPTEAVRNAKKNRVRSYEGKAGWAWILMDVQSDATVDGMGCIVYTPLPDCRGDVSQHRHVARFNLSLVDLMAAKAAAE